MLIFEALDAGHGDALIVRYPGSQDYQRVLLIDGSAASTGSHYKESYKPLESSILPRLLQIKQDRDKRTKTEDIHSGKEKLVIDLAICTHVHDDHIVGVLELFQMLAGKKTALEGIGKIEVRQLWHNSFSAILEGVDIIVATSAGMQPVSVGQGDKLTKLALEIGVEHNRDVPGTLLAEGQVHENFGPVKMTILNPGREDLENLQAKWAKVPDVKNLTQTVALGDGLTVFPDDNDPFNLSSITMLLEGFGRRLLLTGDQLSENIVDALERVNGPDGKPLKPKGKPFPVDLVKVPHHGSKANVQKRFIDEVPADIYVFSANGKDQNPDPEVLELFLPVAQEREFTMAFTNQDMEYVPQVKEGVRVFPHFTDKTEVKTLSQALEHLRKNMNFKKNVNIEFRGTDNKFSENNPHALIYSFSEKP
jgi:ribonuclease BN (tRNA processing enzyme)